MLVLTRRLGERIFIDGGRVVVKVLGFHGKSVRLGLAADGQTRILRAELADESVEAEAEQTAQTRSSEG